MRSSAPFWDRVALNRRTGCLEFTGAITASTGYGKVKFEGRAQDAHRAIWQLARGPIPAGMDVCHTCDNRKCINPLHLFLGSRSDNMIDAHAKGRLNIEAMLEKHHRTLSVDDLHAIDALLREGASQVAVASEFGVARQTVQKVKYRVHPWYREVLGEVAS